MLMAGCGGREIGSGMEDMSAAGPDLQAAPLTLTVGGDARPMRAWYSFYVRPLSDEKEQAGVYLVITAIDPAFDCAGAAGNVDAISFLFSARGAAGISTAMVLARHGPDLATTSGGEGYAQIDSDDDRLDGYDLDGGAVFAGSGGSVTGSTHYVIGGIVLDGEFTAARCSALDFIVPG